LQIEVPPGQAGILECLKNSGSINRFILLYTQSPDIEVRRASCVVAGTNRDPAIVSRMYSLLEGDPAWIVRVAAVQALISLNPEALGETLLMRLSREREPMVLREILSALRRLLFDSFPESVFPLLLKPETMDSAYDLLLELKQRFGPAIRDSADQHSPEIRRILLALLQE